MPLRVSLLALVLLALGGGLSPAWAAEPADAPVEAPAAPDAPADAEESDVEKDAVPVEGAVPSEVIAVRRHSGEDEASSAVRTPRTPPPRA